ncbi:hypothetical protein J2Y67_004846 [Neobacillus niacini]|nr:hypothetical protein [Neobacillus niacini]
MPLRLLKNFYNSQSGKIQLPSLLFQLPPVNVARMKALKLPIF